MHRLWGEDAAWLDEELPFLALNPIAVAILKPAKAPDGTPSPITMEYLHEHMARRLGELPSLRWRIVRVPLGLHHPVFLEDPDFSLSFHLHHAVVPAPGGSRELNRFVASMAERHLDRRHPLWHITLVDGLADGRQAVVFVYHHCLADGTAAVTTFSRIFSGLDHEVAAPAEPWVAERLPRKSRLLVDACRDWGRALPRFPPLLATTVRNVRAVRAHRRTAAVTAARPFLDTPVCSLNNGYVAERVFARAALTMTDVQAVKSAAGVTLNDVALAIAAGAFRRYMLARNELPEKSLTATVPVALGSLDSEPRQSGNRFSGLTAGLATDVVDPWERLRTIAGLMDAAKTELDLTGRELMSEWADFFPPFLHEATTHYFHRRRRKSPHKRDMVNIVVSNLRGPATRWWFGAAEIEDMFLAGPPNAGIGPDVVVWSYDDHLSLTVLSFADSMQDPEALGGYLRESLEELVDAAARYAQLRVAA